LMDANDTLISPLLPLTQSTTPSNEVTLLSYLTPLTQNSNPIRLYKLNNGELSGHIKAIRLYQKK